MIRKAGTFGPEYTLLTDSQDLEHIAGYCVCDHWQAWDEDQVGTESEAFIIGSAFVLVGEGEYAEIWVSESSIPYLDTEYERVDEYREVK